MLRLLTMIAELEDTTRYKETPTNNGVVAWPIERTNPDRENGKVDITFKVKAQVLKKIGSKESKMSDGGDGGGVDGKPGDNAEVPVVAPEESMVEGVSEAEGDAKKETGGQAEDEPKRERDEL